MIEHYKTKEQKKYQEVVTPPELVAYIYEQLGADFFKGKVVIDPCVGPGALLKPLLNEPDKYMVKEIKAFDIQPLHIEKFAEDIIRFKYDDNLEERIKQAQIGIRLKYVEFY